MLGLSSRNLVLTVEQYSFSIARGLGNLKVVKKVVVTKGKFEDYWNEIQQSCSLHKNADTFVTPHSLL